MAARVKTAAFGIWVGALWLLQELAFKFDNASILSVSTGEAFSFFMASILGPSCVVALVLSLVFAELARFPIARRLMGCFVGGYGVYLCFNQVFFRFFLRNYQRVAIEGEGTSFDLLKDSILLHTSFEFAVKIILCFGLGWLVIRLSSSKRFLGWKRGDTFASLVIVALSFGSFVMPIKDDPLVHSPLWDLVRVPGSDALEKSQSVTNDVLKPLFGKHPEHPSFWIDKRKTPKLVLHIVLESIGSLAILDDKGKVRSDRAPYLASLYPHSIVFPQTYGAFPGTVRSHVFLQTGGYQMTWGSLDLLALPILSPTFPSVFKSEGYQTAFFSSQKLEHENLNRLYDLLPFDSRHYPERFSEEYNKENHLNSWGLKEESLGNLIKSHLERECTGVRPCFVQWATIATHHPYSTSRAKEKGDDQTRYFQSLRYTDRVLQDVVSYAREVIKDDFVLIVSGDHGQAFGDRHFGNLLHKNQIYEENVKSFLMISDFRIKLGRVDSRIGSIGDLLPTVADFALGVIPKVRGQSLVSDDYKPRNVFFHKNAYPKRWGLRDGQWKFILQTAPVQKAELFDLEADPLESRNLADQHPDKVRAYRNAIARWFEEEERAFSEVALGLRPTRKVASLNPMMENPKFIHFGRYERGVFAPLTAIGPDAHIVAKVSGIDSTDHAQLIFEWTSPSGVQIRKRGRYEKGWVECFADLKPSRTLEPGWWVLRVLSRTGGEIVRGMFEVGGNP